MMDKQKELRAAQMKYLAAKAELIKIRDEVYPIGSRVRNEHIIKGTVQSGSLYADQVFVSGFHVGFTGLERIDGANE